MFEQVDIGELGEDVINNLQNRAAKKKINLEYTGGPAQMQGVRHVLYEMFYNITDNAIRYTPLPVLQCLKNPFPYLYL